MNFATLLVHIAALAPAGEGWGKLSFHLLQVGRELGSVLLLAICMSVFWLRWEWMKSQEENEPDEPALASMHFPEHLGQGRN